MSTILLLANLIHRYVCSHLNLGFPLLYRAPLVSAPILAESDGEITGKDLMELLSPT